MSIARLMRPAVTAPLAGALLAIAFFTCNAAAALGTEASPQWTISSVSRPTNFSPGGDPGGDSYKVFVTNSGSAPSQGPVTITDELPAGLVDAPGATGEDELLSKLSGGIAGFGQQCAPTATGDVSCVYSGVVQPDDTLIVSFPVTVTASEPTSVTNVVRVSGAGAASAAMRTPTAVSPAAAPFGIAPGSANTALSSVQAGAHPDITTTAAFDTLDSGGATAGNLKDIVTDEPPGFALDLVDTPTCAPDLFLRELCPSPTQVGILTATVVGSLSGPQLKPVYNLAPEPGEIAKIGFNVAQFRYAGDVTLRPAGGEGEYGGQVTFHNASAGTTEVNGISLTVWGVPASPIHDPLRWAPNTSDGNQNGHFGTADSVAQAPYFTNPTACAAAALQAEFHVTSWQHPEASESPPPTAMPFGPIVGCDRLGMEPALSAEVTSDAAYAPTGLDLATDIPQTYDDPAGLATSTLRSEVVTLPEGMTVNPSAGAGLQACSEQQYAEEGEQYVPGRGCPNPSRLASVKISTPLLAEEVTGSVFLAEPAPRGEAGRNPFGSLLALYLIARIPDRGVLIKAPGKIEADPTTGRLTTRFEGAPAFAGLPASEGLPPLPFTVATFAFNQGANAPLVTPPTCGDFTVTAALRPWSDPDGSPLTPAIAPFALSTSCPAGGVPPFAPQVTAYPIHGNAGAYSPFYVKIARQDGEQEITGFSSQLPPGLTGNLSGVPFCSEGEIQQAREKSGAEEEASASCPAASQIGHTIAEAGVGSVLVQAPGKLYLAGPFLGAPFSVVAVTSAHVGPFDLGTVVVHLPLDIDPETAAVRIPAGAADQIPHIIKGIVVHVRDIRVNIDRERFLLNPTNCAPLAFSAGVIGSGASFTDPADDTVASVQDPFQVADCSSLGFAPKFTASTTAHPSRANGTSLTVKLAYPNAPLGTQANIRSVKVELPKKLPSRLPTLQKACTAQQFHANPAGCPAASIVGHAKAITPILPVPLEGPAYFVSHGGEAFPSLIVVLQGYGVTIDLVGSTFISRKGITSSTFKTVPDQPVSSFQLTLPQGPYSALTTIGNPCKGKLAMPTTFTAQNGAVLKQSTQIAVAGCHKAKAERRRKARRGGRAH